MPGSLLRMRSTASSQHTRTASCPLSHRPQYPHPQVHGSSPVGSEFCQVSPRAPPPPISHTHQPILVGRGVSILPTQVLPWRLSEQVRSPGTSSHIPGARIPPLPTQPYHHPYLRARAWESKGNQSSASPSKEERTLTSGTILPSPRARPPGAEPGGASGESEMRALRHRGTKQPADPGRAASTVESPRRVK